MPSQRPQRVAARQAESRRLFPLRGFLVLYAVVAASGALLVQLWAELVGTMLGGDAVSLALPVAVLLAMALGAWLGAGAARGIGMVLLLAVAVLALLAVFLLFADWSAKFTWQSAVQLAEPPLWLWLRGLALSLAPAMFCGLFWALFAAGLRRHSGMAPAPLLARLLLLLGIGGATGVLLATLPLPLARYSDRTLLLPALSAVMGVLAVLCYSLFRRFWPIGEHRSWSPVPSLVEPPANAALPLVGVAAGAAICAWHELALAWDAWHGATSWLMVCCLLALAVGAAAAMRRHAGLPAPAWLVLAGCAAVLGPWLFAPATLLGEALAIGLPQSSALPYASYRVLAALCLLLLAMPMAALGAVLPTLLGGIVQRVRHDGGWGYGLAWLLTGAAFGAALAWSHLMPSMGPAAGVLPAVILLFWVGGVGLLAARFGNRSVARGVALLAALLAGLAVVAAPPPLSRLAESRARGLGDGAQLLWQRRGPLGVVQVYQHTQPPLRTLFVDGRRRAVMAGGVTVELPLASALGLSLAPGARRALVIGADASAGALLASRELLQLDLVEPNALVLAALRALGPAADRVLLDPRLRSHTMSPRRFLLSHPHSYDLIVAPVFGDGHLYSQEFYRLVGARLEVGGIFAQRLPPLGEAGFAAVYKALSSSFYDLTLAVGGGGLVVVARRGKRLESADSRLWGQSWTGDFFARRGLAHTDDLRARFIGSRVWLNSYYLPLPVSAVRARSLFMRRQLAQARFTGGQSDQLLDLRGSDGISLSVALSGMPLNSSTRALSVANDPPDLRFAVSARALALALERGDDDIAIPAIAALSRPCVADASLCGDGWLQLARETLLPLLPWLRDDQAAHLIEGLRRWRQGREFSASGEDEYQLLLALCRRDWPRVAVLGTSLLPPDGALATEDDRRRARTALLAHFLQFELAEVLQLAKRLYTSGGAQPFAVHFAIQSALGYARMFQHVKVVDGPPP